MLKHDTVLFAGIVAILVLATTSGHAITLSPSTHINYLTFSQPVPLPGVTLPAGTYHFELGLAGTHPYVVGVTNKRGQPFYMGFTLEVPRPRGMSNSRLVDFGEAVAGAPAPIAVWYPIDSPSGHAFVYR